MRLTTTSARRAALITGAAAVLTATSAAVYATGAAAPPKIFYACVAKSGGAVRIVGKHTSCRTTEYKINWNKAGPRGATGHRGAPGLSGLVTVHATPTFPPNATTTRTVACPPGKKVLSGGTIIDMVNPDFVVEGRPNPANTGWQITFTNPSPNGTYGIRTYAQCATVAP